MFAKRVTWDKSASSQYQHFEFLPTFCTPPITSGNFPNRWHLARHQPSCIVKCVSKVSDSSRLCACSRIHAPVTNSQKGKTRLTVLQNEFGEVFPTTSLDIAIMDVSFAPLRKTLKPSEMRLLRAFPGCTHPDRLKGVVSLAGCSRHCKLPVLCGNLLWELVMNEIQKPKETCQHVLDSTSSWISIRSLQMFACPWGSGCRECFLLQGSFA